MPNLRKFVLERGVRLTNAFANTPVCCPSRATLLTSRLPHAKDMTISNRVNCGGSGFRNGPEKDSLAVRFQKLGFHTGYVGKYLNTYGTGVDYPTSIPPGWNEWLGLIGNSRYWNYTLVNDYGGEERYGSSYLGGEYLPSVMARRVVRFIQDSATRPFFLWISPPAAHAPFSSSPSNRGRFAEVGLPRTPAFDVRGTDKHEPVGSARPLSPRQIEEIAVIHRSRLEALLSVDELILCLAGVLKDKGIFEETIIVYTSDHGFHLGQFRLAFDKRQPYDFDIKVPLAFAGPGVRRDGAIDEDAFVSHLDLGPTLLDLATWDSDGVEMREFMDFGDGTSYAPLIAAAERRDLRDSSGGGGGEDEEAPLTPTLALIEYQGEGELGVLSCGSERVGFDEYLQARTRGHFVPSTCDHWNNTYACLRGSARSFVQSPFLYCEFDCFRLRNLTKSAVPCAADGTHNLFEYYDLGEDAHALSNRYDRLDRRHKDRLRKKLARFRACEGSASCRAASEPVVHRRRSPRDDVVAVA